MSEGVCAKCGADAVEFDVVAGLAACQECGAVQDEEVLVHAQQFDGGSGEAMGRTFVAAADTGERAAALALAPSGIALAIQRRQSSSQGKLKARVREYCALLRLQPPVVDQALHVLEQAIPSVMGNWRRDLLAAAAAYAACRLNSLPLTLADLAVSTQIEARQLGRHYSALCRLLALQPPLLLAADLLPRGCDRVTAELVQQGALAAEVAAALRRDAAMLADWMQAQLERKQYPLATVGAAIVLAAEMNTVSLSLDHVCSSLQLMRSTLDRKLSQARQRLVQLAGFLPYAASISTRNVGSHARTIIKLSALVGSTEGDQGGSAGGREQLPAPPPPQQLAIEGPPVAAAERGAAQAPQAVQQQVALGAPLAREQQGQQPVAQELPPQQQEPAEQQPELAGTTAAQQQAHGAEVGQKRAHDLVEPCASAAAPAGKQPRRSGSASRAVTAREAAAEAPS